MASDEKPAYLNKAELVTELERRKWPADEITRGMSLAFTNAWYHDHGVQFFYLGGNRYALYIDQPADGTEATA